MIIFVMIEGRLPNYWLKGYKDALPATPFNANKIISLFIDQDLFPDFKHTFAPIQQLISQNACILNPLLSQLKLWTFQSLNSNPSQIFCCFLRNFQWIKVFHGLLNTFGLEPWKQLLKVYRKFSGIELFSLRRINIDKKLFIFVAIS